jgi:tRNA dimethylallyltransferase
MQKNFCIAIVGPTASGKTLVAVELAKLLKTEIISADSRQVYKDIPIASAVPSLEERNNIKHYFIEEYDLNKDFNAGDYGKSGRVIIERLFKVNKIPIIAGGSGLYIKSLIDGFFENEAKDESVRKELYELLNKNGKEYLYNQLLKIDAETAKNITPEFYRRVIRALEVFYVTGKKISELKKENIKIDFETLQFGLLWERKVLYKRIEQRVDEMLKKGLVEEVQKLKNKGYHYSNCNALNTVGIKEVFQYFDGIFDLDTMVSLIKQNTRRYAKRQMTWFNKDKRIQWLEMYDESSFEPAIIRIKNEIDNITSF